MAKRKSKVTPSDDIIRRRKRRTDEELIRDLQEKIRQVKDRRSARELQESPQLKASVAALKALDRALDKAAEEGDTMMRHVLSDSRKPLAAHLETLGFKVPRANMPRGRRPKGELFGD